MDTLLSYIPIIVIFAIISIASNQIAKIFQRIKFPLITGFIIVGIICGPFILGLIEKQQLSNLQFINEIALAFIAFSAGAELYLKELRSRLKSIRWMTFGQLGFTFILSSVILLLIAPFFSFFNQNPFIHISTFGGAEIGCPAAIAVLEITSSPAFLENVKNLSRIFKQGFDKLKKKHPEILVDLRQLGLMMGIEMVNEHCGPILSKTLFDNGVLSVYANNNTKVSQLLPPLVIDSNLVEDILQRVDKGLDDAKKMLSL